MWFVRVLTSAPTIEKVKRIVCKINHSGLISFKYHNKLRKGATFKFVSSHS